MKIFTGRRHERAVHALDLQAQHHHDIDILEARFHVVKHLDPEPLDRRGQQCARRHDPHPRAHHGQQRDVRARNPAVQHITADRDGEAAQPVLAAADRQRVEQRLRRVLVTAVAGIDDGAIDLLRQQLHGARFGMAHHQHIGMHRVQRHRRVDQGLAFAHRRSLHRHVDDIGAEPLAGDLERGAGARRILEEAVDQGAAAQRRRLLVGAAVELDGAVGEVEDVVDLVGGQQAKRLGAGGVAALAGVEVGPDAHLVPELDQFVRNQRPRMHPFRDRHTDRIARPDMLAKHVSGRNLRNSEPFHQVFRLRSFARPRRTEQDNG